MIDDNKEQEGMSVEEAWGPASRFSDYSIGDIVTYLWNGIPKSGRIDYICAAGYRPVPGCEQIPLQYIVDPSGTGYGWPDVVCASMILEADDNEKPEPPTFY